jgi:5'-deoxynucleotidase YfbR-like HD superfamily hydrolase
MSNGTWIQSASNTVVSFENPDPASIHINDIALALSRACRFSGHTKEFYSVAQHSVYAAARSTHSPQVAMYALLHDAHEAYTGDIPQPLKTLLGYKIYDVEDAIQHAVYKKLNLDAPSDEIKQEVAEIDRRLLATENMHLFNENLWDLEDVEKYHDLVVVCWDIATAQHNFLSMYNYLRPFNEN